MTAREPLGLVKGPGETASEFTMIAPDPGQVAKFGEFVYFLETDSGAGAESTGQEIYGRITHREAVRLWPDEFMAQPDVNPNRIAQLLGFRGRPEGGFPGLGTDLYALTVNILGRFDADLDDFINPRIAPSSGTPIFLASDAQLRTVLNRLARDAGGSAYVGDLISRARGAVPIALDVSRFASTHLAIIASTGSGKSYLAGVLLEEMLMSKNRGAVLVVDPHGEYDTLQDMMNDPAFRAGAYRPTVKILRPEEVKLRIDSLTLDDLTYFLPNLSDKMRHRLLGAYRSVQQKRKRNGGYGLHDLIDAVRTARAPAGGDDDEESNRRESGTIEALVWRLESTLRNSSVFDDHQELNLTELFRPGQCTVLQINEIDPREQQMIVATVLRRTYDTRKATVKGQSAEGGPHHLPFPVFCLLEEAHNFSPANTPVVTTRILKTILSEGRKFGVSVGLISQRPGRLDSDVLSQCMTQCIMRIINPVDQSKIAESVESMGRDLIQELPSLSKGQAVLAGASVNTPVLINVRTRKTRHGGQDLDAPEEWRKYFERGGDVRARRARQAVQDRTFDDETEAGPPLL